MKQALPLLAALAAGAPHWPRIGIHDGDNKIVWRVRRGPCTWTA